MTLDDETQQRVIDGLNATPGGVLPCRCGADDWIPGGELIGLVEIGVDRALHVDDFKAVPSFALTCRSCGRIELYSIPVIAPFLEQA